MPGHFSVRDVTFTPVEDAVIIIATTDVPVRLYCRLSLKRPWIHKKPVLRRGVWLRDDIRFCFTVYEDNEQTEPGETTTHTFWKPDWPPCTTKWLYLWATVGGAPCVSTSPLFQYHMPLPPEKAEMILLGEYASRTLISTHGTWGLCWNGVNLQVAPDHLDPNFHLHADTHLNASYWIRRGLLSIYFPILPFGSIILGAKLSIFVTTHTPQTVGLCITEGTQSEPVDTPDWPAQNLKTAVFGQVNIGDLVDDQFNDISFTGTGLDWLRWALTRSHQYESYDTGENAYLVCRDIIWQAQTFTPDKTHQLTAIRLRLKKTAGSPAAYYAYIYETDGAGKPTGAPLCSGQTPGNTLSTATWGDWREIYLGDGCPVLEGVKYAMVLNSPASNAANCASWIGDSSGDYTGGQVVYSADGGTTWDTSLTAYDALFIEYNHLIKAARLLALRTTYDVGGIAPPPPALPGKVEFYHPRKGDGYAPKLTITYKPPV